MELWLLGKFLSNQDYLTSLLVLMLPRPNVPFHLYVSTIVSIPYLTIYLDYIS